VTAVTTDLLDPVQTKAAAETVVGKFGRVDALLHIAGGWAGGKSLVDAPAAWSTPGEICAAMLYLLSEEAGAVNGAKLPSFGETN
jgi:hypothetical protein